MGTYLVVFDSKRKNDKTSLGLNMKPQSSTSVFIHNWPFSQPDIRAKIG